MKIDIELFARREKPPSEIPNQKSKRRRRRGALPVEETDFVPRRRRRRKGIEFYDLGSALNPDTGALEAWDIELVMGRVRDSTTRFNFTLNEQERARYNSGLLNRYSAGKYRLIKTAGSYAWGVDAVFYDADGEFDIYPLSDTNNAALRNVLADRDFATTGVELKPSAWKDDKLVCQVRDHLRINSAHMAYQFDTGNAENFRITALPDPDAPAVSFAPAAEMKIYLVPALLLEFAHQQNNLGYDTQYNYGRLLQVPFPRLVQADYAIYDQVKIAAPIAGGFGGSAPGSTATSVTCSYGNYNVSDPLPAAIKNLHSNVLLARENDQLLYQYIADGTGMSEFRPFGTWNSNITMGSVLGKRLGYFRTNSATEIINWGVALSTLDESGCVENKSLVGIIESLGSTYYVWQQGRSTEASKTQRNTTIVRMGYNVDWFSYLHPSIMLPGQFPHDAWSF